MLRPETATRSVRSEQISEIHCMVVVLKSVYIGNMHRRLVKIGRVELSEDMIADRQIHRQTDRHVYHNTPLPYWGLSN